MKLSSMLILVLLSGCGMTQEQVNLIGAAMQAGADGLERENKIRAQRDHEERLQEISRRPLKCETTYMSLNRTYETSCK